MLNRTRHKQQAEKPAPRDGQGSSNVVKALSPANLFRDPPITLRGHPKLVDSVEFAPNGQLIASGSQDGTICLWNTVSGALSFAVKGHSDSVASVAFSPDGAILASGAKNIKLWDVGSMTQIGILVGHTSSIESVAFSPDGASLVSGSHDSTVRLWDMKSRASISILKGHSDTVESVAFSPDGKLIASGSRDKKTQLWDVVLGTTTATLYGHSDAVKSVTFSPSGELLASGSWDSTIRLWNVATRTQIGVLVGHSNRVRSIAFSPNGKYLASGARDQTTRLWNVATREVMSSWTGSPGDVNCVVFSRDGTHLASGSDDKIVRIWNMFPEEAGVPQSAILTSDSGVLTQSTINIQQDPITPASISFPLNTDITGSVTLRDSTAVGYGGFGDLFLGTHNDHGKVAMKKPRRVLDEALVRRFLREVNLWCSVSHPHILPCLGMCKIGLDVYVVSPFIENGDLLSCMARGMDLNRSKLLFEVAEALTHLHHRGIVHGDVKAQNILLGDDGSALLCDFGMAKAFDTMVTSTESKGAGSLRWMPPELFLGEGRSMASDVYSLGITIAEVLSGRAPYHNILENVAVMFHIVSRDGRPPKEPSHSPEGKSYATLWATAEKCWVKDPKDRPYMAQVLAMLFPLTREKS